MRKQTAKKVRKMTMFQTVKLAIKDKSPSLYASLQSSGKLTEYARDLADQINSEVVSLTQEQRLKQRWDDLGPMECAAQMKTAASLNQEAVLAELLEFPQDETSQSSQG